jgi:hypothetical protein
VHLDVVAGVDHDGQTVRAHDADESAQELSRADAAGDRDDVHGRIA